MQKLIQSAVRLVSLAVWGGMLWAGGAAAAQPEIKLPVTDSPPVIDGVLDDACWTSAVGTDAFFIFKSEERTDVASVKMTRDHQWLYLAFSITNPMLSQVEFNVTQRDDGVQRDESIEIYLDPGTAGKYYYHFVLSAANVQGEQGGRDVAWFIPWRSATQMGSDHWTAELALPLAICAGYGDPAKARINFLYNRINIGLDPYGARIGQDRVHYIWSPIVQSVHEPVNFGYLHGLDAAPMESAFLPALDQANVEPFIIAGKERFYTVSGLTRNYSSVTGVVELVVEEQGQSPAAPVIRKELLSLDEHGQVPFKVKMPVSDFTARAVCVCIKDILTGEILADTGGLDTSALTLMSGTTANRNYYTSEPEGVVRCRLGLPEAELAGLRLVVRDADDAVVSGLDAPTPRSEVKFPLAGVPEGSHEYVLALESKSDGLICKAPFVFNKLAPQPGREVKVDKFNYSLIKDGEPVFPFGIYMHAVTHLHEEIFKLMADAGFNLMFRTINGHTMPESRAAEYMELAQKHNLMVAEWYGLSAGGLDTRIFASNAATQNKSQSEKEVLAREHYAMIQPSVERELKIMAQYPNFLMHKNFDEPNLGDLGGSDMRYLVSDLFYDMAVKLDSYHPVYTLYARYFTDNPSAFKVQEVVTFDVYSYPGWGGWSFDPVKQMAKYTAELRAAAQEHHKAIMLAPAVQSMDPGRTPISLSARDQRAQTYTAIIYGAKGLIYFSWLNIYAQEMWNTLADLAGEVKILAPALLAPEPEQNVQYNPGQFDHVRLLFPMVHARLFNHPVGGYVLLAVNGEEAPVMTEFLIAGLEDGIVVQQMFGAQKQFTVTEGKFTDEIENYGTRAYRIESSVILKEPVQLTLNMQVDESRRQPRLLLRPLIAEIEKQKNHMPNPVFAKRSVYEQFPDFMRPACPMLPNLGTPESGWFLDADNAWNGHPSLCMRWTEPFAKIKHVPTIGNPWNCKTEEYGVANSASLAFCGVSMIYYPPPISAPTKRVFSFYAKGGKAGDKLSVHSYSFKSGRVFELTDDWQRYELSGVARPGQGWLPGRELLIRVYPGTTVWLNGLQMEAGATPTEFEARGEE